MSNHPDKQETVILQERYQLGERHHQTHIKVPFVVAEAYEYIMIQFSYGPQIVYTEEAKPYLEQAVLRYFTPEEQTEGNWQNFLPLVNLLTLSVSQEGHYLGCYHHKAATQEIYLSAKTSSLGFERVSPTPGFWELQISLHCMLSRKGFAEICVIGGQQDEVLSH